MEQTQSTSRRTTKAVIVLAMILAVGLVAMLGPQSRGRLSRRPKLDEVVNTKSLAEVEEKVGSDATPPENVQVIFVNKAFQHARLALAVPRWDGVYAYEGAFYPDQVFLIKRASSNSNFWVIESAYHAGWRLALKKEIWPSGCYWDGPCCDEPRIIAYSGPEYEDQLWTFYDAGNGYFRIYNKFLSNHKMDIREEVCKGKSFGLRALSWNGNDWDDQLFKFPPPPRGTPYLNEYQTLSLAGGLSTARHLLSCRADGWVDLWLANDGSGRQVWKIERVAGTTDLYYIIVQGGTLPGKEYLSAWTSGYRLDLFSYTDAHGGAHYLSEWRIVQGPNNAGWANIIIAGGTEGGRVYLSTNADGTGVGLWHTDDASGRQRWVFTRA